MVNSRDITNDKYNITDWCSTLCLFRLISKFDWRFKLYCFIHFSYFGDSRICPRSSCWKFTINSIWIKSKARQYFANMLSNRHPSIKKKLPRWIFNVLWANRYNPISINNEIHERKLSGSDRLIILNSKKEIKIKRIEVKEKEHVNVNVIDLLNIYCFIYILWNFIFQK